MTVDRLRDRELVLAGEAGQLRHQLRRVKDGLERVGGRDRRLEQNARQLAENITLCEDELGELGEAVSPNDFSAQYRLSLARLLDLNQDTPSKFQRTFISSRITGRLQSGKLKRCF